MPHFQILKINNHKIQGFFFLIPNYHRNCHTNILASVDSISSGRNKNSDLIVRRKLIFYAKKY